MMFTIALAILFRFINNPENVAKVKKQLRELRDALNALDLDDPPVEPAV